jgi:hypothetical protein
MNRRRMVKMAMTMAAIWKTHLLAYVSLDFHTGNPILTIQ